MNRDEQIEDMARIAEEWDDECLRTTIATALYEEGYRKSTEVAREIIADFREMIKGYENIDVYLDRIEKKYTEGKG